ncbi:uncharacterized protein iftap [Rhincodon typus]|uniref:uncharacterized protein iftap n=1 Tax=Rhincodon typus TaxID=259920 RepID=UPI00202FC0AF|nr:uncharacterized protein iftap [Rhincodon typus]
MGAQAAIAVAIDVPRDSQCAMAVHRFALQWIDRISEKMLRGSDSGFRCGGSQQQIATENSETKVKEKPSYSETKVKEKPSYRETKVKEKPSYRETKVKEKPSYRETKVKEVTNVQEERVTTSLRDVYGKEDLKKQKTSSPEVDSIADDEYKLTQRVLLENSVQIEGELPKDDKKVEHYIDIEQRDNKKQTEYQSNTGLEVLPGEIIEETAANYTHYESKHTSLNFKVNPNVEEYNEKSYDQLYLNCNPVSSQLSSKEIC